MRVAFGDFELDTDAVELRCLGELVAMEPRVFDVLAHLVRHRDRVVAKEELLDEVWGDRFVSESALSSCIRHVRRALGDDGGAQRFVKTAHGRGYRFVGDAVELDAPPGAGQPAARQNLPADRTALVGRDELVEQVAALVAEHRLVTLLGMGGVGKTRVAVASARRLLDRFPDGVWFVDLVPADDERSVDVAVAVGCGIALSPGDVRAQVASILDDREVLVVLDNAEHVHAAARATVDHLLEHTTAPRYLVTSREPLGVRGEHRVPVAPLGADGAVELFLAAASRFDVVVEPGDLEVVRHVCARLDGLPLAIELAAGLLRVLGPTELAERIDDRFELLRGPAPWLGERHSSLRSVLADTWDLLDAPARDLLGVVAQLRGEFGFADVEDLVADAPPPDLVGHFGHLVDRSLVVKGSGVAGRFRMLETVRGFAAVGTDREAAADRHAAWCLRRVGAGIGDHVFDFGLAAWCSEHFDDLRAADAHLVRRGRLDEAATLASAVALAVHCDTGSRASSVLERVEEHLGRVAEPALRGRLHVTATLAAMAARWPEGIARHGHAAVSEARAADDALLLSIALVLASWSTVLSDPPAALAMVEEASALGLESGDLRARDHADSYRAFHLAMQRRWDEALAQAAEVIERSPDLGDGGQSSFAAMVAWSACSVVAAPGDAGRFLGELLSWPSPRTVMWGNQVVAATIHAAAGDAPAAHALVAGVRERLRRAGQDPLPDLLVPAAALAHRCGDEARAARWVRAVKDAGRPTQSFQVTCAYRRVREVVEVSDVDPLASSTLEAVGEEALAWMSSMSSQSG